MRWSSMIGDCSRCAKQLATCDSVFVERRSASVQIVRVAKRVASVLQCSFGLHDWRSYGRDVACYGNDHITIKWRECAFCGKSQVRGVNAANFR
jgi:hypothetical protein